MNLGQTGWCFKQAGLHSTMCAAWNTASEILEIRCYSSPSLYWTHLTMPIRHYTVQFITREFT